MAYETNAQAARRLGITKRQASKYRRNGLLPKGVSDYRNKGDGESNG